MGSSAISALRWNPSGNQSPREHRKAAHTRGDCGTIETRSGAGRTKSDLFKPDNDSGSFSGKRQKAAGIAGSDARAKCLPSPVRFHRPGDRRATRSSGRMSGRPDQSAANRSSLQRDGLSHPASDSRRVCVAAQIERSRFPEFDSGRSSIGGSLDARSCT